MSESLVYSSRTKRRKIRASTQSILQAIESEDDLSNVCEGADNKTTSLDDRPTSSYSAENLDRSGIYVQENASLGSEEEVMQGTLHTLEFNNTDIDSSGSCDDGDDILNKDRDNCRQMLASWAVKFGISHAALSALLDILISLTLDVPKDPRTLLMTPRLADIKNTAGGSFYHFGVKNAIVLNASKWASKLVNVDTLSLHFNVDGLPLFGSNTVSLWPILGMIKELPNTDPFVIGIYCGASKPSSLTEYFQYFVEEMKEVLEKGIEIDCQTFKVIIGAFICDAPARAFVKCIKGHTGYSSCERCTQKGVHRNGRMTFPEFNASLRTDVQFDEMRDAAHHTDKSPLQALGVGFVSQFVLDYMHMVCLGVVRKVILLWLKGPLNSRLSANMLSVISDNLSTIRQSLPREFARKPRSLSEVKMWKATEFRQFLLYTGPIVLCGKIPKALYNNFMLLSVSIRFLLSERLCFDYCDYVEKLLVHFVKNFANIYGQDVLVYNIHSLIHIVQDARRYGPLDRISCFPYENTLGKLKKMIRRPQNPLAQIMRRMGERDRVTEMNNIDHISATSNFHRKPHISGPVPLQFRTYQQYKQYRRDNIFISCSQGDNCFEVNHKVAIVKNILVSPSGETSIVFQQFEKTEAFFDYPLSSLTLGIKVCYNLSDVLQVGQLSSFCKKLVLIPLKKNYVVMPLLHVI